MIMKSPMMKIRNYLKTMESLKPENIGVKVPNQLVEGKKIRPYEKERLGTTNLQMKQNQFLKNQSLANVLALKG